MRHIIMSLSAAGILCAMLASPVFGQAGPGAPSGVRLTTQAPVTGSGNGTTMPGYNSSGVGVQPNAGQTGPGMIPSTGAPGTTGSPPMNAAQFNWMFGGLSTALPGSPTGGTNPGGATGMPGYSSSGVGVQPNAGQTGPGTLPSTGALGPGSIRGRSGALLPLPTTPGGTLNQQQFNARFNRLFGGLNAAPLTNPALP
jgi:hypothetical protein